MIGFLAGLQKRLGISSSGVSSIVPTVWLEGCPNKETAPRLWTDLDRVCTDFIMHHWDSPAASSDHQLGKIDCLSRDGHVYLWRT